ncbi:hypothetical protein OE88DRAFT_1649216 [Heliocybe sulcata]|uniref:Uncharacterized protein n=1 Tax=Heliocybe sulcata TaxID=5364 RepID=A0A5C3MKW1_9AGAM|nr:hypothetical protein OE88DRAFT_1649216 [Heliocybe sulcata]
MGNTDVETGNHIETGAGELNSTVDSDSVSGMENTPAGSTATAGAAPPSPGEDGGAHSTTDEGAHSTTEEGAHLTSDEEVVPLRPSEDQDLGAFLRELRHVDEEYRTSEPSDPRPDPICTYMIEDQAEFTFEKLQAWVHDLHDSFQHFFIPAALPLRDAISTPSHEPLADEGAAAPSSGSAILVFLVILDEHSDRIVECLDLPGTPFIREVVNAMADSGGRMAHVLDKWGDQGWFSTASALLSIRGELLGAIPPTSGFHEIGSFQSVMNGDVSYKLHRIPQYHPEVFLLTQAHGQGPVFFLILSRKPTDQNVAVTTTPDTIVNTGSAASAIVVAAPSPSKLGIPALQTLTPEIDIAPSASMPGPGGQPEGRSATVIFLHEAFAMEFAFLAQACDGCNRRIANSIGMKWPETGKARTVILENCLEVSYDDIAHAFKMAPGTFKNICTFVYNCIRACEALRGHAESNQDMSQHMQETHTYLEALLEGDTRLSTTNSPVVVTETQRRMAQWVGKSEMTKRVKLVLQSK